MTVVARTHLCVPAGKSVVSTTVPPLVKGLDDYVCYSVKSEQIPTHPISVLDQFGKVGGSALQPLSLCAPAQINGSALINATTHLVCYGIKLGPDREEDTGGDPQSVRRRQRDRLPAPVAVRAVDEETRLIRVCHVAGRGAAWLAR